MFACIYGFMLITVFTGNSSYSTVRLFFLMCTLLNTFLQTSLYCIAGQTLVSQSAGVFDAAYKCKWLNLQSKDARNLILIMARARKSLYLTAGSIYPMTMLTFCNILRASFGYISFLMAQM
ncbi:odorant receptor Or2-like [Ptiloglossa arizonensis]|uniref:odorant receptor Or2-like n=1 Tax=Ptiloglossa arizonensis TaxID=3350558 RepID=UPI003FA04386